MSNVANPPPSSARRLALLDATDYDPPVIRRAFESLTEIQTALVELSPAFFNALQGIAPKKRHGKVRYVIAAALLVVVGAIFVDGSTRSFIVERGHAIVLGRGATDAPVAAPAVVAAVAAPAPAPVAAPIAAPPTVTNVAPVSPLAAVSPVAPAAKPITPEAKPAKDAPSATATPEKRNSRKATRAPRRAPPQTVSAVALAARRSDGF